MEGDSTNFCGIHKHLLTYFGGGGRCYESAEAFAEVFLVMRISCENAFCNVWADFKQRKLFLEAVIHLFSGDKGIIAEIMTDETNFFIHRIQLV